MPKWQRRERPRPQLGTNALPMERPNWFAFTSSILSATYTERIAVENSHIWKIQKTEWSFISIKVKRLWLNKCRISRCWGGDADAERMFVPWLHKWTADSHKAQSTTETSDYFSLRSAAHFYGFVFVYRFCNQFRKNYPQLHATSFSGFLCLLPFFSRQSLSLHCDSV